MFLKNPDLPTLILKTMQSQTHIFFFLALSNITKSIMKSQVSQTGHWQQVLKINQKLPLKSNNVEFLRWPFWKWRPVDIFRCRESIQDIIIYLHMKFRWNRTMLNLCCIVAAILKMETGRVFQCRDIIIYPHIKFWWYRSMMNVCGSHFMFLSLSI